MNLFKKIFAEKEVKQVLAALDLAMYEFGIIVPFFNRYTFSIIKREVQQIILNEPKGKISKLMWDCEVGPTTVMFYFLANVVADYLGTGQYHVYRGLLNSNGEKLYQILTIALERLETGGFFTHEESENFKSVIDEDIREVG